MTQPNQIFSTGYRPIEAGARKRWPGWAIARTALTLGWRRRGTKVTLGLCAMIVFVHGIGIVAQILIEQAAKMASGQPLAAAMVTSIVGQAQNTFAQFLQIQFFFCAIAMAVIAGGIVADDRHSGALDLYFARPLTRRDYALGKLLATATVPLVTIAGPFLLLWLLAVGIAPDYLREGLFGLLIPGLGGALFASAVLTATIVGLSAHGERGRTVGVVFVIGLLVLAGVGDGVAAAGIDAAGYLSPTRDVHTVVRSLLKVGIPGLAAQMLKVGSGPTNDSAWLSAAALSGYVFLGLGALWARLRAEVVG